MKKNRKMIFGLFVSALFLVLVFHNVDFGELFSTVKQFDLKNIITIVAIYGLSYVTRALRWKYMLKADKAFSLYKLASAWAIGCAMNVFLPARAGDVWRAYEIGANSKVSKMRIFGSVMLERIFDGVSVCTILYFCVIFYTNLHWVQKLSNLSMVLFGGSLLAFYFVVKFNKIDSICDVLVSVAEKLPIKVRKFCIEVIQKICHQIKLFVSGFDVFRSGYYTFLSGVLSLVTWVLECLIAYFVIKSFGLGCPFAASMFVCAFVALGSMIPSSSIFVGPYQYAYILALGIYAVPKSEALAVALIHQSILMGAILLYAGAFLACDFVIAFINAEKKEKQIIQPVSEVEDNLIHKA